MVTRLAKWNKDMNWIIKQIFLIGFLFGAGHSVDLASPLFVSDSLNDGQWKEMYGWQFTNYSQKYGKFQFIAKLDGEFEEDIWPAMWLVNEDSVYVQNKYMEIDQELFSDKKFGYAIWRNPDSSFCDPCSGKRITYHSRWMIRKLRTEFHGYTIIWTEDKIKLLIDGRLTGRFKARMDVPLQLSIGNITFKKISIQ